MFSCSRFLLVELLLFRYVFFRSSHQIAEAGVAGRHRDAELVEAETYERILGTSFIQDNLLFVLDGILGGERKKTGRRGWWHGGRVCCYLLCWHCAGTNLAYLRWAFFISSLQFSHFFSLSETAISGRWFSPFLSSKVLQIFWFRMFQSLRSWGFVRSIMSKLHSRIICTGWLQSSGGKVRNYLTFGEFQARKYLPAAPNFLVSNKHKRI